MPLASATELAAKNRVHFPNETADYRGARNRLLAEEIELRRHIEAVAQQRRQLPLGGEVPENYTLAGANGPVRFRDLFGDKNSLIIYSYMFGPQRQKPCPMCTAVLESWDGAARNFQQRAAIAVFARSPIERLTDWKQQRGWKNLNLYSDADGNYTRAYVSADDGDVPAINVFTKQDGRIHHFWSAEMSMEMTDPEQDPRGAPDPDPLWTLLDMTPEGRGNWYPSLEYTPKPLTQIS